MPTLIRLSQDAPPGENVDFSGIFDAIPEPLVYIGPGRTLDAANRRFREMFPVVIEERLLQCLTPPPPVPAIVTGSVVVAAGMEQNEAPDAQAVAEAVPCLIVEGRPLKPHARPMANGGLLVSFENVVPPPELEAAANAAAELRTQLDAARHALKLAQDTAAARKNALTVTSHELRTPLNAIIGFAEMMQRELFGPLGHERYREYAGVIADSGGYLLDLVNDLLDLAKLDAGKSDLRLDQVEVLKVVVDCVKAMESLAARSQIGISVHVYDGVTHITGDDVRLHQMVLNLVSNAVKFTEAGGEICIDVFRRGRFIGISVSDSGAGISQADMARVLEPFERSESGRAIEGTGLGLPLTRELAHLHGGELKMESMVGEGTTITVLLPADGPAPPVTLDASGKA